MIYGDPVLYFVSWASPLVLLPALGTIRSSISVVRGIKLTIGCSMLFILLNDWFLDSAVREELAKDPEGNLGIGILAIAIAQWQLYWIGPLLVAKALDGAFRAVTHLRRGAPQ